MHLIPVFMKRLRSSAVVTQRKFRIPSLPVLVSSLVVLALLILGIQNRGDLGVLSETYEGRVPFSKSEDVSKMDCFEQNPWVQDALDHHFKRAEESKAASTQTSEESIDAMKDIKWGEYSPGQDLVELVYSEKTQAYDLNITERFPANVEHKSRCIRIALRKAIEDHGKALAEEFGGKSMRFVVTTEDFGIVFRHMNSKLPAFAMSTDRDHVDVPVPDFTFGCYPETHYDKDSWLDVRNLLLDSSSKMAWSDRVDALFHRSNWGVGPRRGLMPLLEKLHKEKKDIDVLGTNLDIKDTGFATANMERFVPLHEQCKYKSQIHTAGLTYSAGLKYKLACGSLVIKFTSKFEEFYEPALKDGVHVIQVDATDDGVDEGQFFNVSAPKIKSAVQENKKQQSRVAKGGQNFVQYNLTEDALSCYWYGALQKYGTMYFQ